VEVSWGGLASLCLQEAFVGLLACYGDPWWCVSMSINRCQTSGGWPWVFPDSGHSFESVGKCGVHKKRRYTRKALRYLIHDDNGTSWFLFANSGTLNASLRSMPWGYLPYRLAGSIPLDVNRIQNLCAYNVLYTKTNDIVNLWSLVDYKSNLI
jgi:hypothetical protein